MFTTSKLKQLKKQGQPMKVLTKGEITKSALTELKLRGVNCWPQNNLAVKGRKFIGRKGISDIIGFHSKKGVFVACEVKTINDSFSDEQREFLTEVQEAGGIALVATQEYNAVVLKQWEPNATNYKNLVNDLKQIG